MNCNEFEERLELYLYGELAGDLQAASEAHLASCAGCRARLDESRRLHELLARRPAREPTPEMLVECRQALGDALDREAEHRSLPELFQEWLSVLPASPRVRFAGVLGVLLFGFGLGWMLRPRADRIRPIAPDVTRTSIVPPELDSVRIGGISRVEPDADTGEVHITLDTSRRVTVQGSLDDPRIQQLLISAVKSYDNPGIRRETLDALRGRGNNPNIRQALLYAMAHDSNLGVRLEALDAARGLEWGPDSRLAFLDVLEHDMNPELRAAAIDELAKHSDQDLLPELARFATSDPNRYVRLKCAAVIHEMGATK